jgi:C1A family cysteine protease
MPILRSYGWVPDKPSPQPWFKLPPRLVAARPSDVNWSTLLTPAYDQGQLGSCTANALARAVEFCRAKEGLSEFRPSRLFIYYNERVIENSVASDAGAALDDGIATLRKQGACSENDWPYAVHQFAVEPSQQAYADALTDIIKSASPVQQTIDEICGTIALGWIVPFGFAVYESFESQVVATSGLVPMPGTTEKIAGYHAVVATGYDDPRKLICCRNSWGPDWGDGGDFWLPYDYVASEDFCSAFWQIDATGP